MCAHRRDEIAKQSKFQSGLNITATSDFLCLGQKLDKGKDTHYTL
jgi:hypothetical protein